MNAQRDVSEYRVRMDRNRLPQQVETQILDMFKNAQIRQVYRNERLVYEVIQPSGKNESVTMVFSPTGDVLRVRPSVDRADEADRAANRENRRDRQNERSNARENRNER
jgi:hypothetical protein